MIYKPCISLCPVQSLARAHSFKELPLLISKITEKCSSIGLCQMNTESYIKETFYFHQMNANMIDYAFCQLKFNFKDWLIPFQGSSIAQRKTKEEVKEYEELEEPQEFQEDSEKDIQIENKEANIKTFESLNIDERCLSIWGSVCGIKDNPNLTHPPKQHQKKSSKIPKDFQNLDESCIYSKNKLIKSVLISESRHSSKKAQKSKDPIFSGLNKFCCLRG